jgi:hypothetical protein
MDWREIKIQQISKNRREKRLTKDLLFKNPTEALIQLHGEVNTPSLSQKRPPSLAFSSQELETPNPPKI